MAKLIRILQIVTQMNKAGLENRLMDIYRNIDRSLIQFDFFTFNLEKGDYDDEIVTMGGTIYYNESISMKNILMLNGRLVDFFKSHDYKIVHCHMNQWCGIILKSAYKTGIPVRIAHSRTALSTISVKNIIKNIVKLPVNKYATHKFAVSKKAAQWLYGKKPTEKGEVIIYPNAINCGNFKFNSDIRNEYRNSYNLHESFVIVHVGNIRPEKNHKYLIDIFSEIKKTAPESKLLIIGRDHLKGAVQEYSKKKNVYNDTIFLGSRNDVANFLFAGDAFVFPSLYEGFPGAVLEAQTAGLPCIISETITDEVCILPTTIQLSLNRVPAEWADATMKQMIPERETAYENIVNAGFDIETLINQLTEFYANSIV